jgi:ABC-2 type transport system ATP-binding protein
MGSNAVEIQDVSKRFRLYHEKYTSLKERVIHAGRVPHDDLWALRDVTFDVKEGETVGILGRNGSGKSTLLKCICGVLQPTFGQVVVRGKLAGLLELGAGFQSELSGRDNIYMNGSMLGMSKRDVDKVFDDIVAFAELEQFIDNQVKFYSSGMYVRLGFAVAVNVDPDVLVVDEVLAVGDERFQGKCMDRIKSFQEEGRTILFVSHSPEQVRSICDRAVVLSDGVMVGVGNPGEAVRIFREGLLEAGDVLSAHAEAAPEETPEAALEFPEPGGTWSGPPSGQHAHVESRPVRLGDVSVESLGLAEHRYMQSGDPLTIHIAYEASQPTDGVVFMFEIRDVKEQVMIQWDSQIIGQSFDVPAGHGQVDFTCDAFPFLDGAYSVVAGIRNHSGGVTYDYRELAARFEVMHTGRSTGVVNVPFRVGAAALAG